MLDDDDDDGEEKISGSARLDGAVFFSKKTKHTHTHTELGQSTLEQKVAAAY